MIKHVLADVECTLVTYGALPTLVLGVHLHISLQIKALQVSTMLATSCLSNCNIRERTGCVERDHARLFSLLDSDVVVDLLLTLEKLLCPIQARLGIFDAGDADLV